MDVELLKTFLEVHRSRHFGNAARHLCLTQSAVSARVRLLEDTLGVQLFSRKRHDIRLTAAGERLLRHAETIVTAWERARQEAALESDCMTTLRLAAPEDLWDALLETWLYRLHRDLTGVALQAGAFAAEVLVRRLLDGALDLAFLFEPPPLPGLTVRQVAVLNLLMVSSRAGQTLTEATSRDYVLVDWGTPFALDHARSLPPMPAPRIRLGSGRLGLGFLLACGGVAYLAEHTVQPYLEQGRLFRVEDAPLLERSAYAAFRPGTEREEVIRQALSRLGPPQP